MNDINFFLKIEFITTVMLGVIQIDIIWELFITIKLKIIIAYKLGELFFAEIINVDLPRDNEVLVEVKATGICHTYVFTLSEMEELLLVILCHESILIEVTKNIYFSSCINLFKQIYLFTYINNI